MKKFITEPLIQFVAIGLVLFIAVKTFSGDQLQNHDDFEIVVDNKVLIHYLQLQAKRFSADDAEQRFYALPANEKKSLVDDYVRDQVLFREAMALGLDDNDEVIRRRLIQKMEYIAQGFYHNIPAIGEEELTRFFAENREDYQVAASVSFTHVFFESNKHGIEEAKQLAQQFLAELNMKAATFAEASQFGDRFLFNRNYIERTAEYIRGHFGKDFEKNLFTLKSGKQWQGPFQSDYGFHLVLMKDSTTSRLPSLDEVSQSVLANAQRQQQQTMKKQAVDNLIGKYTITNIASR